MIVPHRLKESNKARRRVMRVGWFVVEESWGDIEGWGEGWEVGICLERRHSEYCPVTRSTRKSVVWALPGILVGAEY